MKCQTSNLEIETLYNRIQNGDMDLQPNFQRGEVWSEKKKQKLIDSILRGWKIPPIHVVHNENAVDEVLDGQQRLVAIRDFCDNKIAIDGFISPCDEKIQDLDGMNFKDLPPEWQRRFRQYTIILVRLTEYNPEEPAELFFRLNQPVALTSAEQRNAYVGITRNQVKDLSRFFVSLGANQETLGFSNSRLAYDEIISKFCYAVEINTLKKKITSNEISEMYRNEIPFTENCIQIVNQTIEKFMNCINISIEVFSCKFRFNKATIFSWLVFFCQNLHLDEKLLSEFIANFECFRSFVKRRGFQGNESITNNIIRLKDQLPCFDALLHTFNQRTSMGSTDSLSIIYRDIILHIFKEALFGENGSLLEFVQKFNSDNEMINFILEDIVEQFNWGENIHEASKN